MSLWPFGSERDRARPQLGVFVCSPVSYDVHTVPYDVHTVGREDDVASHPARLPALPDVRENAR